MASSEYLGQEEFRVAVGPARAVYLIRAGSRSGYVRAVQEASTRWAGVTEPIVPVRANGRIDGFWRQVVDLANVDQAVNVDLPDDLATRAAGHLGLQAVPLRFIDRHGIGRFTCHPSAISSGQPTSRIDFNLETFQTVPTIWTLADPSMDLWAVTAAGALTEEAHEDSQGTGDFIVEQRDPSLIALAQIAARTGLDRTTHQFGERWASPAAYRSSAIVWITKNNALLECLLYWNRRVLRPISFGYCPMLILPESELEYWLTLPNQVRGLLEGRPDEFAPDVFLCSNRVPPDRLRAIGLLLGLTESTEDVRVEITHPPPPPRQAPFTFVVGRDPTPLLLFRRRYGVQTVAPVQVFRERTAISFDLPVRFEKRAGFKVNLASAILDVFPNRREIAPLIAQNAKWHEGGLEFLTETGYRYRFEISIPTLREATIALLTQSSSSWDLSDKGRMAESIMSAESLAALLERGVYEAVRDLTTRRSQHLMQELAATAGDSDLATFVIGIGGRLERRSRAAVDLEHVPTQLRSESPRVS